MKQGDREATRTAEADRAVAGLVAPRDIGTRPCVRCGNAVSIESRYCGTCGQDQTPAVRDRGAEGSQFVRLVVAGLLVAAVVLGGVWAYQSFLLNDAERAWCLSGYHSQEINQAAHSFGMSTTWWYDLTFGAPPGYLHPTQGSDVNLDFIRACKAAYGLSH